MASSNGPQFSKLRSAAIVVAASLLGLLATPSAANAQSATYTWVNIVTGKCLDSRADGYVYLLRCNDGQNQDWIVNPNSAGETTMKNRRTGKCIERATTGLVFATTCNSGIDRQRWYLGQHGTRYELHHVPTGNCIVPEGNNVDLEVSRCGTARTAWALTS
jgi:Ricin-type beta-trefoil lectin domain